MADFIILTTTLIENEKQIERKARVNINHIKIYRDNKVGITGWNEPLTCEQTAEEIDVMIEKARCEFLPMEVASATPFSVEQLIEDIRENRNGIRDTLAKVVSK